MIASQWKNWIGPTLSQSEQLSDPLAGRWSATFDLSRADGDTMPQGIHFCLANPHAPTARLGADGHPRRDTQAPGFLPPIPLPRRMWAGSSIVFQAPLVVGQDVERNSRILSITEKAGTSGRLVFVEVEHEILTESAVPALREVQTIVFREAAEPDAPLAPPVAATESFDPAPWDTHRVITPTPALLMRYSALTFNAHRIHYDLPYAQEVERYRGLVVHGPLLASMLLQLAAARYGENALRDFSFRGLSPAIAGEPLHLALRASTAEGQVELAAFAADGRQVTRASATLL